MKTLRLPLTPAALAAALLVSSTALAQQAEPTTDAPIPTVVVTA